MWYQSLLETNVTHQLTTSDHEPRPCSIELKHPEVDWDRSWSLAVTPGLSSKRLTFLWRMVHDLLPTQARLFRLHIPNILSEDCSHCNQDFVGNLTHSPRTTCLPYCFCSLQCLGMQEGKEALPYGHH